MFLFIILLSYSSAHLQYFVHAFLALRTLALFQKLMVIFKYEVAFPVEEIWPRRERPFGVNQLQLLAAAASFLVALQAFLDFGIFFETHKIF